MKSVRPMGLWVLCDNQSAPEHDDGIWLPDEVRDGKATTARVLAVGEKVRDLKPGDVILIADGLGRPVEHEGRECYLVKDDGYQVLGVGC